MSIVKPFSMGDGDTFYIQIEQLLTLEVQNGKG